MAYNRFLPLIVPLITLLLLEVYRFHPRLLYVVVILVILLFFFTARQFILASKKKEKWLNYFLLPALFFGGLTLFSTMIPSKFLVQSLFVINTLFIYFYFRAIYHLLSGSTKYGNNVLQNLSSYGNFLAVYFVASSVYGLQVFLGVQTWLLMVVLLFVIMSVVYQVLWANGIDIRKGYLYALIMCLVLVEIAWSASFLTLSFYILGLIFAICYYILIGLIRFYLLGRLTKSLIKIYLIFGFSSILVVLLTANWVSFD